MPLISLTAAAFRIPPGTSPAPIRPPPRPELGKRRRCESQGRAEVGRWDRARRSSRSSGSSPEAPNHSRLFIRNRLCFFCLFVFTYLDYLHPYLSLEAPELAASPEVRQYKMAA